MKLLFYSTIAIFVLALFFGISAGSVQAAGWVDHRFMIELPDGTKKDFKGAKMHVFHVQNESGGASAFTNTCYYPGKEAINENPEWGALKANIGSYSCSTPSSCRIIDYGAPFLPKSFNENSDVYTQGDASYFSFYNKTFTKELEDSGYANLAKTYQNGNIRGFDGAKWIGEVNFSEADSKGPVAIITDQGEIDRELNSRPDWGKAGFDGATNRWGPGEIYKDPQGGNVLHAQITWVLKPPTPVIDKPTASFTGKCTNTNPGVPSFTYNLSNIDLKGQEYSFARIFLRLKHDANESKIIAALGEPYYTNSGSYGYNLKGFTAQPVNMVIDSNTPIYGKDNATKTTLGQFISNTRSTIPADYTFEVAANLESKSGDTKTLNDYIVASFKPKFVNNECGTPPTTPPAGPMCTSISMLNTGGNVITDYSSIKPGDQVKFTCGRATGVTQYAFRIVKFNANNVQDGTPISLQPETAGASISRPFTIPADGGKFLAQCAICPNGQCQAFEPASYTQRAGGGATTPPAQTINCPSPNSCTTAAGCLTVATGSNLSCGTGEVCCANRARQE